MSNESQSNPEQQANNLQNVIENQNKLMENMKQQIESLTNSSTNMQPPNRVKRNLRISATINLFACDKCGFEKIAWDNNYCPNCGNSLY